MLVALAGIHWARLSIFDTPTALWQKMSPVGGYGRSPMAVEFLGDMMTLIWTKQLSVGNEMLDSEHKDLIGMVNRIEYAIETRDITALSRAFKLLMNCVYVHFANEERFAQAVNIPFEQHRLAHQHLQKELQHTWNQLEAKNGIWPEYVMDHYPQFLREWLVECITKEDMLMKPALQAYPYDFKPG